MMASLLLLSMIIFSFDTVHGLKGGWQKAHATFYGGEDASGTMGKCFCVCVFSCSRMIPCLLIRKKLLDRASF